MRALPTLFSFCLVSTLSYFVFHAPPTEGDDPPRDRTSELRALGFPSRRLGPVQMTTDTALGVTKLVVQDKSTSLP